MRVDVRSPPLALCAPLLDEVVGEAAHLLLDREARYHSVGEHRLVVTGHEGGFIHRNSKHAQLVPQSSDVLEGLLHGGEFRNTANPVRDLRVIRSPPRSQST